MNSPEELAEGQALVDRFMLGYRGIFPTVPPKLHFLEDHCVQQVPHYNKKDRQWELLIFSLFIYIYWMSAYIRA